MKKFIDEDLVTTRVHRATLKSCKKASVLLEIRLIDLVDDALIDYVKRSKGKIERKNKVKYVEK